LLDLSSQTKIIGPFTSD